MPGKKILRGAARRLLTRDREVAAEPDDVMNRPITVLLVEASSDHARQIREALANADGPAFAVLTVDRVEAALEQIRTGGIDVVLLDLGLPDSQGVAPFDAVHRGAPDLPVIVFTDLGGEALALQLLRRGAQDYLVKGEADGRAATRAIRYAIERSSCEAEIRRLNDDLAGRVEALRESEALYRKLIETSFDGIVRSEDSVVCEVNTGFARMFGYTVDEVLGRPISDLIAEESLADVTDRVAREIEGTYELAGKRKDGTKIQLEATARSHDAGGRRSRLTAVRDVTEKRVLEEQFQQAQKLEAVGRLAGGVAHDFNNLLMVISSYGELLLDDLGPNDPRRSHVDEVLKASRAAAGLTRQLLAFSRQQVIQPRLLSLEHVVRDSERMLQRLIGEDIELVTVLSPTPATVRIDPGQLEQVIMNLAVNARDAMLDGGRITIETTSVELSGTDARAHWPATPGHYAMLAVTDTGVGMDDTTRARIFEPFFTTKEMGKGTGLGLSMVYGIVKQSAGFIWVYSEPGQGTTFKIYLPRLDETAESTRHPSEIAVVPRGTETVLLVEDEPAVRGAVQQILERHGYSVLVAAEGPSALTLIAAHPDQVQLLITDLVMPGMSGRQLAAQFSALRPDARVLYMSGYTSDGVVRHGVLEPGIAYLQKPFSAEALVRKVRRVLDGS